MVSDNDRIKDKVAACVEEQFRGDYSKVKVLILDYAEIHSPKSLLEWSENSFNLKKIQLASDYMGNLVGCIYDSVASQCKSHYIVVEMHRNKISPDMKQLVFEFKTSLSFHLFRDYGRRVLFLT